LIATAQTTSTFATSPAHCWGETYSVDPWSNLQSITATTNSQYTGCTQESGFSKPADGKNHLSGFSYDAPGNTMADGINSYVWDAEGQLTSAGGVTYLYDGDGRRVQKSNGKLYWYGTGSDPLNETDLAGNTNNSSFNEYVFFGGARIARRDSANAVNYYFSDYLGSARVVTNAGGTILDDSDFYPFGVERPYASASGNVYKFEKKERDTETGNDDFGARYYSNRFGRWLSSDWSAVPVPVPYANFTNPQTLNLYAMVRDNPESFADLDGHCCTLDDVAMTIGGIENAFNENNGINAGGFKPPENQLGRAIGNAISVVTGGIEVLGGAAAAVVGGTEALAASPTIIGSAPGVALAGVGIVGVVHGSTVLKNAVSNSSSTGENSSSGQPYENTPENKERMQQGKAPVGKDGKPVELHHPGQENGPTKEMTQSDHRGGDNFKKNHTNTGQQPSKIDRNQANQARRKHWKEKAKDQ
jgi:RHS repeat-associated protein